MLNESVKQVSESQRITKEVIGMVEYEVEEGNPVFWGHAQELLFEINRLNERNAKLVHENDELMAENEMRKNNELKLLKAMRQIISNTVSDDVLDIAESVILDITNSTLEELR